MGLVSYVKNSFNELSENVSWPTWAEAQKSMVTVAVFSVVFALVVAGIDYVFNGVIDSYFEWVING